MKFLARIVIFELLWYDKNAKLTEYSRKRVRAIIMDSHALFLPQLHIEFDKNANSTYVIVVTPFSRKVSLATIGVCVFCAWLRSRTFYN